MSLTITTPSGSRVIDQFAVVSDDESRQIRAEREDDRLLLYGDALQVAAPLVVEVYVQGGTNGKTGGEVQRIIDDAKVATSITTPRGTRAVLALMSHSLSTEGRLAVLRLEFAPSGGGYS